MRVTILPFTANYTDKVLTVALWQNWLITLEDFFFSHINGRVYAIDSYSISDQKIIGTDNNKSSETLNLYPLIF